MNDLSLNDFYALSPLLAVLITALTLLFIESFFGQLAKKYSATLAFIGLIITAGLTLQDYTSLNPTLTAWLKVDEISKIFTLFFALIGLGVILLSTAFFKKYAATEGEYYFLLMAAIFGLILIASSADFLMIFIGLETLSLSLYVLCGYMKQRKVGHEAAIKYFLMGAFAAAILVYGIAFIYGAIGTTNLNSLLKGYQGLDEVFEISLFLGGISLVTVGLAFKAAIFPFHAWAPDVYEGAPTPVTAFMAVGTKVGAFVAFIRVFLDQLHGFDPIWSGALELFAIATLIYGNFVALRQTELKRFFAYSGISHAGFLLIPFLTNSPDAFSAILFYLGIYSIATLGAFSVLVSIENLETPLIFNDLKGLFYKQPFLSVVLTLCLLTLAGIPPTAGFFAKFYIFKLAFGSGLYTLLLVALLTTILSAYYYLRIVALMLAERPKDLSLNLSTSLLVMSGIALFAILFFSIYPEPLMALKFT